ncbi:multidrug transporter [Aureimonas altamirensis]|uniref:Multidrug transporter n=1 Tax=Aureimonas altamirensis TaxID=370622 RepID=A0A0B1Q4M9_9HYPH|nr:HlyD family secretion protein [Aureimonas altamirensis]KHJ53867.1 multidrug transporter [Aureimonas altamirensis]
MDDKNQHDLPADAPEDKPADVIRETPADAPVDAGPAKTGIRIGVLVIGLMVAFVAWYAVSDKLAPYTDRGTVSGYVARIAPRVSGQVISVQVQDNTIVQEGDLLYVIDPRPFEIAVQQAEVELEQATQSIDASSAALVAAQARVSQARANLENATTSNARTESLVQRGIVARQQEDASRTELEVAQAQVDAAEADLASAEAELGAAGANNPRIKAAQLGLERAQLDLIYTQVVAPTLGVVTNLDLAIGQYVNAGSAALTFIDGRGAWITADMRENQLANIEPGNKVGLLFDALPGQILTGTVHSVGWGIDTGRTASSGLVQNEPETRWFEPARRFPVRIELDGGHSAWPRIVRVGAKATVVVYAAGENNPSAWIAMALHRAQSLLSYLY